MSDKQEPSQIKKDYYLLIFWVSTTLSTYAEYDPEEACKRIREHVEHHDENFQQNYMNHE